MSAEIANKCVQYLEQLGVTTKGVARDVSSEITFSLPKNTDVVALILNVGKTLGVKPEVFTNHNGTQACVVLSDDRRITVQAAFYGSREISIVDNEYRRMLIAHDRMLNYVITGR